MGKGSGGRIRLEVGNDMDGIGIPGRQQRALLAAPGDLTVARATQFPASSGIKYVLAQFADIHGVAKSKAGPLDAHSLGEGLIREFLHLKQAEWLDCHRHASDWEVERYPSFH